MSTIYTHYTQTTPQTQPMIGRERDQSQNAAGGYSFDLDDWKRLDRFLILGTEGGTYYIDEGQLTRANAGVVLRCIQSDGVRTVNRIVDISKGFLAPKNDPAIFALALCAKNGDSATRSLAYKSLSDVCRTGTMLFQFAEAINSMGGWGRGARKAVANWYTEKTPEQLAYQVVKYRQRGGWTHRDLLRLSHPKPSTPLLAYIAGKGDEGVPSVIDAYETAKTANVPSTVALIKQNRLPREAVRTEFLNEPAVLEALLQEMPATALVRNLGNLTKAGVIGPFSDGTRVAINHLTNEKKLASLHPMAIYLALTTYASGQGFRGSGSWTPVQRVVDALNDAFYATMKNVVPSGKRLLIAIDTSGSMAGDPLAKAAAMALIQARTESNYLIIGVDTNVSALPISPTMRLDDAIRETARHCGGGTDLSLPYRALLQGTLDVDGVVVYTDSETWAGHSHPAEVLRDFRKAVGHPVRNAVVSMVANAHSVGHPRDPDTLQVVGLDASLPNTLSAFFRGEF